MGNYILKDCLNNRNLVDEDQIPLLDYSHKINDLNEKSNDIILYLNREIEPVIDELKSRLYHLEVKNNSINRELTSIKYKITENEDEFCSILNDSDNNIEKDKNEKLVSL